MDKPPIEFKLHNAGIGGSTGILGKKRHLTIGHSTVENFRKLSRIKYNYKLTQKA